MNVDIPCMLLQIVYNWFFIQMNALITRNVMIDDFETHAVQSNGDLWSEICSSLPEPQVYDGGQFTDSFEPSSPGNPQRDSFCPWEPMADSKVYIASLGTGNHIWQACYLIQLLIWFLRACYVATENRLKRIKGQPNEVTSREMLRSLSQAKKECWDRFLHDAETSELFQEGNFDQK